MENIEVTIKSLLQDAKINDNKLSMERLYSLSDDQDYINQIAKHLKDSNIELVDQDEEPEEEDVIDQPKPFDVNKINIVMDKITISSIITRLRNNEIKLDAAFQRKSGLWSNEAKSRLIESILLRIPLPAFYFDANNEDEWTIIDGLQRISAIKEFIVDKTLKLDRLEYLTEQNGKYFDSSNPESNIGRSFQRRIEETNLNAYLVKPSTPHNVKFNIFKRINTGGLVLSPQEIRNALNQGKATTLLNDMAKDKKFILATSGVISAERMLDKEYCLRYITFCYYGLASFNGVIDELLNATMEWLNKKNDAELLKIREEFSDVMDVCYRIFDKHTFRRMGEDGRRRQINKVLFAALSYVVFKLSAKNRELLIQKKESIKSGFSKLCSMYSFDAAIRSGSKYSYEKIIFPELRKLINNHIGEQND
jgi:hypothetical protein